MFKFLLIQWKLNKIDLQFLGKMVAKGKITEEQMKEIISTNQVS